MNSEATQTTPVLLWRNSLFQWVLITLVAVLTGAIFYDGIIQLAHIWDAQEEYSHGYFIPILSLFLVWQQKDKFAEIDFSGSWAGLVLVVFGIFVFMLGQLSTLYIIVQYALLIVLVGLVLAYSGWRGMKLMWVPLLFLVFMIPLPPFLYQNLSGKLQLISSELGVMVVRWFGISVYLEGNVIDLGAYKLQVVEACSGLRYLFPLTSFGFICAYFLSAPLWQRIFVLLSTVPITVIMNSFRIGVIGILVDKWGTEMAEGFLHDFEGWVVFMACIALLILEMWILTRLRPGKLKFREVFGIEYPEPPPEGAVFETRKLAPPYVAAFVVLIAAASANFLIGERIEVAPDRDQFVNFPDTINEWQGRRRDLDDNILATLDLTDYIMTNYKKSSGELVNLYVAYYDSQRAGAAAHSPRACIPGGGWKIKSLTNRDIGPDSGLDHPLQVNRLEIRNGEQKQLVYYWFKQRDRLIWSEYLVKWYLFWDSLTKNRTDGALIRLSTVIDPDKPIEDGDKVLLEFIRTLGSELDQYVPD